MNPCPVYVWWAFTTKKIKKIKDKQGFIERVIDRFRRDLRRLQLVFASDADSHLCVAV